MLWDANGYNQQPNGHQCGGCTLMLLARCQQKGSAFHSSNVPEDRSTATTPCRACRKSKVRGYQRCSKVSNMITIGMAAGSQSRKCKCFQQEATQLILLILNNFETKPQEIWRNLATAHLCTLRICCHGQNGERLLLSQGELHGAADPNGAWTVSCRFYWFRIRRIPMALWDVLKDAERCWKHEYPEVGLWTTNNSWQCGCMGCNL